MLFNSIEYVIFLPLFFIGYWFIFKRLKLQNIFVVISSYIFYGWWDWRFLILIAFTTLCSYASGILIERQERRLIQRWICAANITLNWCYAYLSTLISFLRTLCPYLRLSGLSWIG